MTSERKVKYVDESHTAAYEKDGVLRSAFQRRELVRRIEYEDGTVEIKVRKLTKQEYRHRIDAHRMFIEWAIRRGYLVIDENGRETWNKH